MITDDHRRYLFEELCTEAEWASIYWRSYRQLFGNANHVEVMRKTARMFFGVYQQLLTDGMLLRIQKLLDPAISKQGDPSATLEMLLQGLPPTVDGVKHRFQKRLETMRRECKEIKDWRKKQGAHLDLRVVLIQIPPDGSQVIRAPKTRNEQGEHSPVQPALRNIPMINTKHTQYGACLRE